MELNERQHAGEFLLSWANGNLSFDNVTIAQGEGHNLEAGTVLAQSGETWAPWDPDDSATPARGVLLAAVDATVAAQRAAIVARVAEVNAKHLIWPEGAEEEDIATGLADLAEVFIIGR